MAEKRKAFHFDLDEEKLKILSLTEEARSARQAADILNSQRDGNTDKIKDSEKGLL